MKGVILTAGKAKRLRPATNAIGKVCLPIYDKPMIFYPLSILIGFGIKDIYIVCSSKDKPIFENLFKRYNKIGALNINLVVENKTLGTAYAFNAVKDFCQDDETILIFGDNLMIDKNLIPILNKAKNELNGATVFGKNVNNPQSFGVIEKDNLGNLISIEEKPMCPKSDLVMTGLMMFDKNAFEMMKKIKPSIRGEYEITDLVNMYIKKNKAKAEQLSPNCIWLDTGTHDSMLKASEEVKNYQKQNGIYGSVEIALYNANQISENEFEKLISCYSDDYQNILRASINENEKQV